MKSKVVKNVLITGGATNEYIDEVMKITNMSTGRLSIELTHLFHKNSDYNITLVANRSVSRNSLYHLYNLKESRRIRSIFIETTEDMLNAIKEESTSGNYDLIIHTAAVADYKPEFSFLMEDLAKEIAHDIMENTSAFNNEEELERYLLDRLVNPNCELNSNMKISSYQPNLTIKLGLTPKIIARLREWFPDSKLVGFKLLENVSKEHIVEVAYKLCNKNSMDYIIANDLAELRKANHVSYLVNKDGYTGLDFNSPSDIFEFVKTL